MARNLLQSRLGRIDRVALNRLHRVAVIPQAALEHAPLIGGLGGDDRPHDSATAGGIVGAAILLPPQQDIARNRPFDPRQEAAVRR